MKSHRASPQNSTYSSTTGSLLASFVRDSERLLGQAETILQSVRVELSRPSGLPSRESCVQLFGAIHALRGMASLVSFGKPFVKWLTPLERDLLDHSKGAAPEGRFQDLKLSLSVDRIERALRECRRVHASLQSQLPEDVPAEAPRPIEPSSPARRFGGIRLETQNGEVQVPLQWVLAIEAEIPEGLLPLKEFRVGGASESDSSFVLRQGRWIPMRNLAGEGSPGVWLLLGRHGRAESYLGGVRILGLVNELSDDKLAIAS